MIIVEGSIQSRNYEDRNGNKRTAIEVVADNCMFGESKGAESKTQSKTQDVDFSDMPQDDSEDLPF